MNVPSPEPEASPFECPSCGNVSAGPFCTQCGERRLGTEDRSLRHYFDTVANFLTHFDSKGYVSLWYLVTRPGFLSAEQLVGRRVPYAKPLALFISINVVYYLSVAWFNVNTFTTPLSVQLGMNDYYAEFAQRVVQARQDAGHLSAAAFEARYNERVAFLSKTLIFLFIPIHAGIFHALFFRQRRYFVEHAVVATHLWAMILLLLAVLLPAAAALVMAGIGAPDVAAVLARHDVKFAVGFQLILGVYALLMFRRVYGVGIVYAAVAATLVAWSFFHVVWLYRFVLFVIASRLV